MFFHEFAPLSGFIPSFDVPFGDINSGNGPFADRFDNGFGDRFGGGRRMGRLRDLDALSDLMSYGRVGGEYGDRGFRNRGFERFDPDFQKYEDLNRFDRFRDSPRSLRRMPSTEFIDAQLGIGGQGDRTPPLQDRSWTGPIRHKISKADDTTTYANIGTKGTDLPYYSGWWRPRADIYEEGDDLRVEFELPGVPRDAMKLLFENADNSMILSTEKPLTKREQRGWYFQNERHFGNFYRKLKIPYKVDSKNATATLHHGVLKITLPIIERLAPWELPTTTEAEQSPPKRTLNIQ